LLKKSLRQDQKKMCSLTFYILPAISINESFARTLPTIINDQSFAILNAPVLRGFFSHCYANEISKQVKNFVLSFLHEK
jgi:hypothetical protein